jgi:starch phosphorylase
MAMSKTEFFAKINENLLTDGCADIKRATAKRLHNALARAVMGEIAPFWNETETRHNEGRRAYYLSAEFLMGRSVFNNLYCAGLLNEAKDLLNENGVDIACLEEIEDAALGNGGLGRLAACFLDSAATCDIPLNGYGIRYKYGLFKQSIDKGFQRESPDAWLDYGDAWSVRREEESVTVDFGDGTVVAVPYDTPVIGYGGKAINTLRLWQSEPIDGFDFSAFDSHDYIKASESAVLAESISDVLYPNDNGEAGLRLRIKQQYFFVSASIQDIIRRYKAKHGDDFSKFAKCYALQLNDTHPTVAIPELVRLLMFKEGMSFTDAFDIAQKTCNYTNHTVMAEALEKWDAKLYRSVLPVIYEIILLIDAHLKKYLLSIGQTENQAAQKNILDDGRIHMARMAVFGSSHTNGVARLHTDILKKDVLKEWYDVFPDRFQNKTNGITPRRWLGLCNKELSDLIAEKIGGGFISDLAELQGLKKFVNDSETIGKFIKVKQLKKQQLCDFIAKKEGVLLNPNFVFDVQVKRLHEYKRQLLNAFSIMDLYFKIKEKKLPDLQPTAFIFGAKAAPAYRRAKGIIKYINEVAKLVNNDPDTSKFLYVLFLQN